MIKGTITEFFTASGFGYLKNEEKNEYCFYSNDVAMKDDLFKKGDQVHFDLYEGHGVRAVNVRRNPQFMETSPQ